MSCRDEAYNIINMDQTPVPFSYDPEEKTPLKWLDKGQYISGSQHPIQNVPHVL